MWHITCALLVVLVTLVQLVPANARALDTPHNAPFVSWNLPKDAAYKNTKPLIGILTQPCSHDCPGTNYVSAAFVKWVESAGARPVPIRYHASDDELLRLFNSVNGLIFPGGLTWLWLDSPYVIAARKLFNWAVEANDKGDVFPIHGTCLGFQLLHILASNVSRNDLLVETNATSHASTLEWAPGADKSRVIGTLNPSLFQKLADPTVNIAMENHEYGLPPPMYEQYPVLSEWYNIISTSKDRQGIEYVSTVEGKKYPFTGTQWHPEKPPYEFGIPEIPHTLEAVAVAQHMANMLVDSARYSAHRPQSHEQELDMLIYNTPPTFSMKTEEFDEDNYDGPDMTYFLDQDEKPPHGPDDGPVGHRYKAVHSYAQYKAASKATKDRAARLTVAEALEI